MSDQPVTPDQTPVAAGEAHEIEVDLAAFLPEGVTFEMSPPPTEAAPSVAEAGPASDSAVDLDALSRIERDLDAVDAAIAALDAGTYGIDPSTGAPIDDAVLAADPARLS